MYEHYVPLLAACFTVVTCLAYFSALMMEELCASRTSDDFQVPTWRYMLEDRTFYVSIARSTSIFKDLFIRLSSYVIHHSSPKSLERAIMMPV
jgi:hypothetical protein